MRVQTCPGFVGAAVAAVTPVLAAPRIPACPDLGLAGPAPRLGWHRLLGGRKRGGAATGGPGSPGTGSWAGLGAEVGAREPRGRGRWARCQGPVLLLTSRVPRTQWPSLWGFLSRATLALSALGRIRCPDSPPSWFLLWVFPFVEFSPKARSRGCSNPSHRPPLFHRTFDILISPSFHLSAICPILPGIIHNFIKRLLLIYDINLFRSLKPPVKVRLIISSLIFCKQFHSVSGI